jgi:hypothetical protein
VTPADLLIHARGAGLRLAPRGDKLYVEPTPPPGLRAALVAAKPELLHLLRSERRDQAARLLSDAYDRLGRLAPWTSAEVEPHRALGATVDLTCRAYVEGATEWPAVEAAVSRWEVALSVGRMPRPDTEPVVTQGSSGGCPQCGPRAVALLDLDDGVRLCPRCGFEAGGAP